MSNIRAYYQPLYDAIEEYKKIHEKWEELNYVYEYLDEKSKKKKKKKKKKFKKYLRKAREKRKNAWKKVFLRNLGFFGIWFMVFILCLSLVATVTPLMVSMSILWWTGGLVLYNKEILPKALERKMDVDMLLKYQQGRGQIDDKTVGKILDSLRWELYQLREKEYPLEKYIEEYGQKLIAENTTLANEILESYGINAEIEMKPRFKQLSYPKER